MTASAGRREGTKGLQLQQFLLPNQEPHQQFYEKKKYIFYSKTLFSPMYGLCTKYKRLPLFIPTCLQRGLNLELPTFPAVSCPWLGAR